MAKRPNFVLFLTDQQRADHLSCYGNPVLKTPNIDRIAAKGTRFESCFVANPICMPNRASMMTGRMPSCHGVRANGIPLDLRARTFVEELRTAGYATALFGKAHFQNMTGREREFDPEGTTKDEDGKVKEAVRRGLFGDDYEQENTLLWRNDPNHHVDTPFYGFDHVRLATWHGDLCGGEYERWLTERCGDPDAIRGADNALPSNMAVPQAWRTSVPEDAYPSAFVGDTTLEYLDQRQADGDHRPFFLQVSFPDPHHPFTPPGKYWDMYDPDDIPLPDNFDQGSTALLEHMRRTRSEGTDNRNSQIPFAVSAREAKEAIALTYGMIAMIDDQVGRVLDRLEEQGLMDDTVLIFASDHGDMMGELGILLKGPLHYRGATRVPLIWSDPKAQKPDGQQCDGLASSIDIPATILDRAGLKPYYGMQGQSLLPMIDGDGAGRDAVLIEDDRERKYLGFDQPQRLRSIVTAQHRLTIYRPSNIVELYDLGADPGETTNIADDPAEAETRAMMMEALSNLMIDMQDKTPYMTGLA
ncbi:sulfatase [Maritimibacter dapengensis]|uniref:Sulfatase-like hydrolase/transferase n=1 Tax=Maritimibacter dapengensis TaxID=2836868 RepID=A0ABS6SZP4_9RHOB|nr:sulfatase-like hydrolase/transferase [Maritimibacter dapengensis]MBV7377597.1 sulfatase-like hydrolase/transferase [Maritimibacter dapengensis]